MSSHVVLPPRPLRHTRVELEHVTLGWQLQPPLAAYEMHSSARHGSCASIRRVHGRQPCEKPYLQYIHAWWCTMVTLARQSANERKRSELSETMHPCFLAHALATSKIGLGLAVERGTFSPLRRSEAGS